jgi:hypothetical protein
MSKITRYNGNLKAFASEATGTERTIFGDTAQSDELDANITVDLLRGWGVIGVDSNPTKQHFNGLAFTLGQLIAYLHQQGVPEWNAAQEYYEGSVVTTLAGIYRLKSGGVGSSDPDTDGGINWELIPTQAKVDAKADQATTYTETEVDGLLDAKADQATTYTETEVDGLLDDKADISGQIFTGEINYRGAGGDTTNTGYGENVLQNNTTGNSNTANGTSALQNNTTGNRNTANGRGALQNNTEGNKNTANGRSALYNNTEGNENTANGAYALYDNTTGNSNTANGKNALFNNTIGNNNTAYGYNSGYGIETGSGNSIFGANVTGLAPDLTDNLILASGGVIRLQHDGVGTTTVQGDLVADNLYTETEVDNLLDDKANISGQAFSGNISAPNLSGTNTGDGVLAIGVGQTWQNMTASRASGVTYTNSTGKPITAAVYIGDSGGADSVTAFVGATIIYNSNLGSGGESITFIIPAGSTYKYDYSPNPLMSWVELR